MGMDETNELLGNMSEMLRQASVVIKNNQIEIAKLKEENTELIESQKTWDRIKKTDALFDFKEVAKLLGFKKYGRNTILGLLRDKKVFMSNNEPYQKYSPRYFKQVQKYIEALDEEKQIPVATQEGVDFVRRMIQETIEND